MLKKVAHFLVDKRYLLFGISMCLVIVSLCLLPYVSVNRDMTKYLPKDSGMKQGLTIMQSEFPEAVQNEGFKLMVEGLTKSEKLALKSRLEGYEGVESVTHDPESVEYNSGKHALFAVTTTMTDTTEAEALMKSMVKDLEKEYTVYSYYVNTAGNIMDIVLPLTMSVFLVLLVLLCKSYIEIFLLLAGIGVSVLINMGTNALLGSLSDMTLSIAAVLQLVLSIDYSILLLHRYEQEKKDMDGVNNPEAMKRALVHTFSSILSSAFTTIVGLLVLLLMSFTVGRDIGLVLSKGIFCSLICVFTVTPSLILWCDKLLTTTNKAYLRKKRKNAKKEVDANA